DRLPPAPHAGAIRAARKGRATGRAGRAGERPRGKRRGDGAPETTPPSGVTARLHMVRATDRSCPPLRGIIVMRLLLVLTCLAMGKRLSREALAADEPPTDWIEPATGHRVIRLSRDPGTASFYGRR